MIVITESQLWSRYREFLCVCACHSIIVYFTDVINFIGYVHLTIMNYNISLPHTPPRALIIQSLEVLIKLRGAPGTART